MVFLGAITSLSLLWEKLLVGKTKVRIVNMLLKLVLSNVGDVSQSVGCVPLGHRH